MIQSHYCSSRFFFIANLSLFLLTAKVLPQLVQRPKAMRDFILALLRQLGVRFVVPLGLEYGIPAKVATSPRKHDIAVGTALEQQHLALFVRCVRKGAHGLRRFVLPAVEQLVQTLRAQLFQEPLDVGACEKSSKSKDLGLVLKRSQAPAVNKAGFLTVLDQLKKIRS